VGFRTVIEKTNAQHGVRLYGGLTNKSSSFSIRYSATYPANE
jgi:hypothetical protein